MFRFVFAILAVFVAITTAGDVLIPYGKSYNGGYGSPVGGYGYGDPKAYGQGYGYGPQKAPYGYGSYGYGPVYGKGYRA
ncbi:hypothetical protein QR680_015028 [Steinernema hermaphroditum]|uniref:Uncharacterized protein n=1 Tax=Steinernema hermaphroditum TaxID=289476 RepID=A0AA39M510_9BILA|nr:hypothetical protein QR680_015028 [Steinernema hermaphroditum]